MGRAAVGSGRFGSAGRRRRWSSVVAVGIGLCSIVGVSPPTVGAAPLPMQLPPASCSSPSAGVGTGLQNIGFETGNLAGWSVDQLVETICVTGGDDFATPYEGSFMARLGEPAASNGERQNPGQNILSQTFVVEDTLERFVYNLFTYDYTGFDDFRYTVVLTVPNSGEVISSFRRGAWGTGTSLKTTGWQYVEFDLTGHVGEQVRLELRAGGTIDNLYAFWAYIDSAESGPPPAVAALADVSSQSGSVMVDPQTGQITVAQPAAAASDLTISSVASCVPPTTLTSAKLLLNGQAFPMSSTGGSTYAATIPAFMMQSGTLSIETVCDSTVWVTPIGGITLYDPSGDVTDAVTGNPIVGAEVRLFQVPGWLPGSGGSAAQQCQNDGPPWTQASPTALGELASIYGDGDDGGNPLIEPDVNPFITNDQGRYGWDVAEGCWFVEVRAAGYETVVSPVVGVPPAVTTLDIAMQPIANAFGSFVVEDPCVVLDTTIGSGAFANALLAGGSVSFAVSGAVPASQGAGTGCGLPAGASGALVDLRAVAATQAGNLRVGPAAGTIGGGAVNFTSNGLDNSNVAVSPIGAGGTIVVEGNGGSLPAGTPLTELLVATTGHVVTGAGTDSKFVPITACTVGDTRASQGASGAFAGPVAAGSSRTYQVAGAFSGTQGGGSTNCGVPANATAVLVNVVAVNSSGTGRVGVRPSGGTNPWATTGFTTLTPAMNNSAATHVRLSAGGAIDAFVSGGGQSDVRLVVLGYHVPGSSTTEGLRITPITACTAFDTRTSLGASAQFAGPVLGDGSRTFQITGDLPAEQGGADSCDVPLSAQAVMVNLVAVNPLRAGNLRIAPSGQLAGGGVVNFANLTPAMNNSNTIIVPLDEFGRVDVDVNAGPAGSGLATVDVRGVVVAYLTVDTLQMN